MDRTVYEQLDRIETKLDELLDIIDSEETTKEENNEPEQGGEDEETPETPII